MKLIKLLTLAIAFLSCNCELQENVEEEINENMDWFSKPKVRPTQLFNCPEGEPAGVLYAIPEDPDCSYTGYNETTAPIKLNFYVTDVSIKTIKAHHCFLQKRTYYEKRSWWFTDGRWMDENFTFAKTTSRQVCKDALETDTYKGEELTVKAAGIKSTNDRQTYPPYPGFYGIYTNTQENFVIVETVITVDVRDNSVLSPGIALNKKCFVNETSCMSDKGILIWRSEKIPECRLKVGQFEVCIKSGRRVTCPNKSFVLKEIKLVSLCGESFFTTGYGLYFSLGKGDTLFENSTTMKGSTSQEIFHSLKNKRVEISDDVWKVTMTFRRKREAIINSILSPAEAKYFAKQRNKRSNSDLKYENPNGGPLDSPFVTWGEYMPQQRYLLDVAMKGTKEDIENLHQRICQSNYHTIHLANYLSGKGDATTVVRALTGDRSLRASFYGDLLNVWKCQEIYTYSFKSQTGLENCTSEWPIAYIGDDAIMKHGYVEAHTHNIVDIAKNVPCPPPSFHFKIGKQEYIHLTNKSVSSSYYTMVNHAERQSAANGSYEYAIPLHASYTHEEQTGRGAMTDIQRAQNNAMLVVSGLEARMRGAPTTPEQDAALKLHWDQLYADMYYYFKMIGIAFIVLASLIVLVILKVYWDGVIRIMSTIFNCHGNGNIPVRGGIKKPWLGTSLTYATEGPSAPLPTPPASLDDEISERDDDSAAYIDLDTAFGRSINSQRRAFPNPPPSGQFSLEYAY